MGAMLKSFGMVHLVCCNLLICVLVVDGVVSFHALGYLLGREFVLEALGVRGLVRLVLGMAQRRDADQSEREGGEQHSCGSSAMEVRPPPQTDT